MPARGDWQSTPDTGWQHGAMPSPPSGVLRATRVAWETWFASWFAAHWTPDDLPVLRQVIRYYDRIERGDATAAELNQYRQLLDSYGITPKGQQDRRWARPKPDETPAVETPASGRYAELRVVGE